MRSIASESTPESGWTCSCPALGRCAHVLALQAVTVRPEQRISGAPRAMMIFRRSRLIRPRVAGTGRARPGIEIGHPAHGSPSAFLLS